jgi:hypothetical protein
MLFWNSKIWLCKTAFQFHCSLLLSLVVWKLLGIRPSSLKQSWRSHVALPFLVMECLLIQTRLGDGGGGRWSIQSTELAFANSNRSGSGWPCQVVHVAWWLYTSDGPALPCQRGQRTGARSSSPSFACSLTLARSHVTRSTKGTAPSLLSFHRPSTPPTPHHYIIAHIRSPTLTSSSTLT